MVAWTPWLSALTNLDAEMRSLIDEKKADRGLLALAVIAAGYGLADWSIFAFLTALGLWLLSVWLRYR